MSDAREQATARLEEIWRLATATIRPMALAFYKPNVKDRSRGVAAKFNLRLKPQWNDKGYLDSVEGGLFVDLVAQGPEKNGFPQFEWEGATRITAKLGLKDVASLRAAIRDYRVRGVEVATYLRGKSKDKPNVVSLFHQHESAGTTGISYQFEAESSFFQISKSKDLRRSINLLLDEELQLDEYLAQALTAFVRFGVR